MAPVLWALLGIVAGACVTVQASVNAALARGLGLPLAAGAVSFLAGAVILSAATLLWTGVQGTTLDWKAPATWTYFAGGALGALFVTSLILLAPRIGTLAMVGFVIAGQLTAGLILDRIGFLGLPVHDISPGRVAGALLLVAGAVLVRIS